MPDESKSPMALFILFVLIKTGIIFVNECQTGHIVCHCRSIITASIVCQGKVIPPVSTCNHVWILNEYVALASINIGEARSWWSWRISDNHPLFGHPTKILVIITNWLTVTKYQYFSNGNRSFTFYRYDLDINIRENRMGQSRMDNPETQTTLWKSTERNQAKEISKRKL
jgi:hypothetical protein